ncbi:MAG: hypothetical protein LAT82_05455 [Nanoarchaeota archaeon]|nr:hypothetical protein [Nanoarchaeota archaeon]
MDNSKIVVSKKELKSLVKELIREEFNNNNEFLNFRGFEKLSSKGEEEINNIIKFEKSEKFKL